MAMYAKKGNKEAVATAAMGRPPFVQRAKILGARPLRPIPYRTRVAANMMLLAAENAAVKIPALTIDGRTVKERKFIRRSDMVLLVPTFYSSASDSNDVGTL